MTKLSDYMKKPEGRKHKTPFNAGSIAPSEQRQKLDEDYIDQRRRERARNKLK